MFTEGDIASNVFCVEDNGPCWMTPEEQIETKWDQEFEGEVEKKLLRSKKDILD